jgi:hypothetical protein
VDGGDVVASLLPFLSTLLPPVPVAPCAYINQLKALVTLEDCHLVIHKLIRVNIKASKWTRERRSTLEREMLTSRVPE